MAATRPSSSLEFIEALCGVGPRRAGSDAERRAALLVARRLRSGRRIAELETFWCRPSWAMAQAWHVALGILGSLLSVEHARVGGVLVLAALLFVLADALWAVSPGRRLTPERASQNVVSHPAKELSPSASSPNVKLILTAGLDAGRTGLAYRPWLHGRATRLRLSLTKGRAPGWQGWLVIALAWTLLAAALRASGDGGAAIAVLQFIPTIGLVAGLALLVELAAAEAGPGAADNGSGVALALAAARALDAAPPASLSIEVVITGAADGQGLGLRHHLRGRRAELTKATTIVIGLGPAGAGEPMYLTSDGPLAPLAFARRLTALTEAVSRADPSLKLRATRSRGVSPALPARSARLPALTLASSPADGTAPRSHDPSDLPEAVDAAALDRTLHAVLQLVDAIDGALAEATLRPA